MPTLQEDLSNPKNQSGFFNPDTGEPVFAESHSAAAALTVKNFIDQLTAEVEELRAQEQDLVSKMGEARRPKPTTEIGGDGGYVQKGQSGQEMKDSAEIEAGVSLDELKAQIAEKEKQIQKSQADIEKMGRNETLKKYQAGEFLLSVINGSWHIYSAFPSKLNTPAAKKFLSDMQSLTGKVVVVANDNPFDLDENSAGDIDSFVNTILQKSASMLNSISSLWIRRAGFTPVRWYD